MVSHISELLIQNLTKIIYDYGYFAIFILMTAESALIPIPSEVTMPFAGFLVGRGVLNFWFVVLVGALANLTGSLLAFWLGKYKGEEWTRDVIRNWGKYILVREKDFDLAKKWFIGYGQWIAFGSRLLPIVRTYISLPAGISKMNVSKFSLYTFLGSFIWSAILAYIGLKLGSNWQALEPIFKRFQILIIAVFVILILVYIYKHIKKKD